MTATIQELTLTRIINSPRARVWKAWTDSTFVARWWGPQGFTNPVCELTVRPGGSIRIDMRSSDGVVYPMIGTYLEIVELKLLVFTSAALDKNHTPLFTVLNTITFVEQDGKTELLMHASVSNATLDAAPYLAGMETGWTQSLARLEKFIETEMGNVSVTPGIVARWSNYGPQLKSTLRIVSAIMFMLAGTVKLFAFPIGMPPHGGTVPLLTQLGIGGVLEVFGGALLILGLYTRPVAFLLAGEMAVAYFQFHFPESMWPVVNGGVSAVLYCFVWLYFSAAGAGPWSLDAKRGKE